MAKLVVNSGLARGREFQLKPGVNSFGRAFNSDFRLEDSSVSGAHAQIVVDELSVTVKDLGSTNGTFINRSQVREGFLQPGQVISLGGVEMMFVADTAAESPMPSGGIARTVALPQIGGIKIARPSTPAPPTTASAPATPAAPAGGFRAPINYPAPTMPTPSLTTAPTALAVPAQQHQQQQQQPAPVAPVSIEARTWKHVEVVRPEFVSALRCLGFGAGAMVVSAGIWITAAALAGAGFTPYSACVTGLICGLAMRMASRNRPGAAFSLLAAGFGLLAMFSGEAGQVFVLQTVSFRDYNLVGLGAGLALAFLIGGVGKSPKAAGRPKFA